MNAFEDHISVPADPIAGRQPLRVRRDLYERIEEKVLGAKSAKQQAAEKIRRGPLRIAERPSPFHCDGTTKKRLPLEHLIVEMSYRVINLNHPLATLIEEHKAHEANPFVIFVFFSEAGGELSL